MVGQRYFSINVEKNGKEENILTNFYHKSDALRRYYHYCFNVVEDYVYLPILWSVYYCTLPT